MRYLVAPIYGLALGILLTSSSLAQNASIEIAVDQAGYLTGSEKLAMVKVQSGHPAGSFSVRRTNDNSIAVAGTLPSAALDDDSGDRVQVADFSKLHQSGSYYIEVPGIGRSWDFTVGPDVYRHVYYLAVRGFYGQRCGTAVDMGPDYPEYHHAICHIDGAYDSSSGKSGRHDSAKGWHDAGDYGRYVVNGGISTGTLLWAWELYRDRIRNISLKIPNLAMVFPIF